MPHHLFIQDNFFSGAKSLRKSFEQRFADPRATRSDRFVWDYWHVPEQYTLVRTPAQHFFPAKIYRDFLGRLGSWAQETLGCSALTPPWLSYYVEGCRQELHSDVPHGPWAYVFSLTPRQIFSGGETLLLRPEVLDYWRNFKDAKDREQKSFVQKVAPRFNRLVVFDPRIPHGVTEVRGVQDPREARLVVHGWFTEPKPFLKGGLSARQVAPILDEAVDRFLTSISALGQWHGVVSLRIKVNTGGKAALPIILADTLTPADADPRDATRLRRELRSAFSKLRFPKARSATEITLPLLFHF
jgi:hypothetical protein